MELGTLPELDELERILADVSHDAVQVEVLHREHYRGRTYPVHVVTLARDDGEPRPTLMLMAGVHGLERIGTQVLVAYLRTLTARLRWDAQLDHLLRRAKIVLLPLFNPIGVLLHRRANARGVDLMRNAPITSPSEAHPLSLYRGQSLSARLPYYRGKGIEPEVAALTRYFQERLFTSAPIVSLDLHSGFGHRDQLWFPYAHSRQRFPQTAEVLALSHLLEESHPHHRYVVEPQARHYTVHGDLWDYLYQVHQRTPQGGAFLPLTLEMASWGWIRKNPRQFTSRLGLFHPIKAHRVKRVLRRHLSLLDFLTHATASPAAFCQLDEARRSLLLLEASKRWPELHPGPPST